METTGKRSWLMLTYKVPREPTSIRVSVWRKLKKLGAISLHDAVWILPAMPKTNEHFRWLVSEIEELKGQATLMKGHLTLTGRDDELVSRFNAQISEEFKKLLAALKRKNRDLAAASRTYQQISTRDYFQCASGSDVRGILVAATEGGK